MDLYLEAVFQCVQRLGKLPRQQPVVLLCHRRLELLPLVEPAFEKLHIPLLEQARLDQQLEVVDICGQQEEVGQLRLGRELANVKRSLTADVLDHAFTVSRRCIRYAAVACVQQDAHGILQAAVGHPFDSLPVEQPVLQRADSCTGIYIA